MARLRNVCVVAAAMLLPASLAAATSFQGAVEIILNGQKDGPVTKLNDAKRKELAACIVKVLDKVPNSKKTKIAQGKDFDQMQDRFGEVVMADHAKLKQQITLKCGEIATSG